MMSLKSEDVSFEGKGIGGDHANSYGGAYADPRCEMKKRQQQEIVVSGLTINTSDISSGEEEDNGGSGEQQQFLLSSSSNSKMMPDESGILMSLIEPSVRKIGGGGAVSLSAFQVRSNLDHQSIAASFLPNLLLIAFWGPKLNCCIS